MARRLFFLVLAATWLLANLLWGAEWKFTDLGNLGGDEGGGKSSQTWGISRDGSIVVGDSISAALLGVPKGTEAFVWQSPGRMQGLGTLAAQPFFSSARAASRQGRVIVGESRTANGLLAFRWTAQQNLEPLDLLPRHDESVAYAVSGDGTIIVGECRGREATTAYRWTEAEGPQPLSGIPGGRPRSTAYAISDKGAVIVGQCDSQQGSVACLWNDASAVRGLGDLPGGRVASVAYGVSADGTVVVGSSFGEQGAEAFRWTDGDKMMGIGDLPGGDFFSTAYAVSADGQTIVGQATTDRGSEAFVWTATTGMQSLQSLLKPKELPRGWQLVEARGISDDGQRIVGIGAIDVGQNTKWPSAWLLERK